MIITKRYTEDISKDGYRVRNRIEVRYLLGFILIRLTSEEIWKKGDIVDDELRIQVLEADGYQCVYCGLIDRNQLSVDHVVPQISGGATIYENLVTACRSCNSAKNGKTPEEANMPPVYGRYKVASLATEQQMAPIVLNNEELTIVRLFLEGKNIPDIVNDVYSTSGRSGGGRYQIKSREVQDLLRRVVMPVNMHSHAHDKP